MHQTGPADFFKSAQGVRRGWWRDTDVREYIDDMMSAFAANDLIISACGSNHQRLS
jgi:UDP-N-acetylglucosamine:LPS N-acetylglucosamine transferase